jgi:hypothetical protein
MTLLANPAQDQTLSDEEREFAREIVHAYGEMVRKGEAMFSQFCEDRGVPEHVCMRAMIQIGLHRTGTNAAHLLAVLQADDMLVATEGHDLAGRLKATLEKQIPLSRETDARTPRSTPHA